MRWIAALLMVLTMTAAARAAPTGLDAQQSAWQQGVMREIAGRVAKSPDIRASLTKERQFLSVQFTVGSDGRPYSLKVRRHRNATSKAATALERTFAGTRFPAPPKSFKPARVIAPVVLQPHFTREEMITLLEETSRNMSRLAEKLKKRK